MAWIGRLLVLCVWTAAAWQCGVTSQWQEQVQKQFLGTRRLQEAPAVPREETLSPIRIVPFFGNMTQMNPMLMHHLRHVVLPGALAWYRHVLKVHRVIGNLKLQPGDCWGVADMAGHTVDGVADADLVVYVTAMWEEDDWVARAGGCAFDGGDSANSPIAGVFEFNAYAFKSGLSYAQVVHVVRHELAHIIAFNSDYYPLFRQPDGTKYENPVVNVTVRGVATTALVTPRVVAAAKEAFACSSLKSLELENYGGSGTAGSHWEKRIMFNDFMVGDLVEGAIYSNITLAIFEDSGWYEVNYTSADEITFGRGAGCKFFTSKCIARGKAQLADFCDRSDSGMCDLYNVRKAWCSIGNFNDKIPAAYQYFTNKTTGGLDPLMDYCPVALPMLNGDCKGRGLYETNVHPYMFGEKVCEDCMCFTGTYVRQDYISNYTHSGCHEVQCRDGSALVLIGRTWIQCPQAGGRIDNIPGFDGYLDCPPYFKVCRGLPCPAGCSGFGACFNGKCFCDDRHFGADCGHPCDETCMTCMGEGPMNCTSCYPSQTTSQSMDGTSCDCAEGQIFNTRTNECVTKDFTCHASCGDCFGPDPTNCLSCADMNATLTERNACMCNDTAFLNPLDGTCTPCHKSCQSCKGPLPAHCTSCRYGSALPESAAVGKCDCLPGYFMTPNNTCEKCLYSCKACSDWSTCTECYEGMTLNEFDMCDCPTGTFQWMDKCIPCDPSCSSCYGMTKYDCKECLAVGATVDYMFGGCVCSNGFFLDYDINECRQCHESCESCSGPEKTDCLVCHSYAVKLKDGSCECMPGSYLTAEGICGKCPYKCASCSSADVCTKCRFAGASFSNGACGCPKRKFPDFASGKCMNCHPSCAECNDFSATNCTSCQTPAVVEANGDFGACVCPENFELSATGSCKLQCSGNCRTCVETPTTCTSCNMTVATLLNKACVCRPWAFADADGSCRPCDRSCASCDGEGPDHCLSCTAPMVLSAEPPSTCVEPGRKLEDNASGES